MAVSAFRVTANSVRRSRLFGFAIRCLLLLQGSKPPGLVTLPVEAALAGQRHVVRFVPSYRITGVWVTKVGSTVPI